MPDKYLDSIPKATGHDHICNRILRKLYTNRNNLLYYAAAVIDKDYSDKQKIKDKYTETVNESMYLLNELQKQLDSTIK